VTSPYREPATSTAAEAEAKPSLRSKIKANWMFILGGLVFVIALNGFAHSLFKMSDQSEYSYQCRIFCESTGSARLNADYGERVCTCVNNGQVVRIGPNWEPISGPSSTH